ncbi:MAG: metallophosphoesterase [Verrucomicrobiia bacterium]
MEAGNETRWTRRSWLRWMGMAAAGGGVTAVATPVYGRWVEPDWLAVERVRLRVRGLPDRLAGFTVAHLSDFHADGYLSDRLMDEVLRQVTKARPDLIALTGDFITRDRAGLERMGGWVGRMDARLGIFGCLGNHDRWHGRGQMGEGLGRMGVELLVNRGVELSAGIFVAGVDSAWGGKPELRAAMAGHMGSVPALLLAHEPDWADAYAEDPRIRIQLSGHTHGGQVRVPGWGAPILPRYGQKYDAGLFQVKGLQLYTNRGLGMVGVPFRVACPPELTLLTLVPDDGGWG